MNDKLYGKEQYYDMWYELFKESLRGMGIGTGGAIEASDERNVLDRLKNSAKGGRCKTLFDVGANAGEYTKLLLEYFPEATIHSFEPAVKTYCMLKENIQGSNVVLNNFGISDKITEGVLYYDREGSGLASLYNRQLEYSGIDFDMQESVKLDTLDHYCEMHGIDRIDLLKMDIEGNELNALKGAERLLAEKRIENIQIEFGGCNIDSRTYFRDFWNLLHNDYKVFRILRDGIREIPRYGERLECFVTTNYLFMMK